MLTRLILTLILVVGCSTALTAKTPTRARHLNLSRAVGCLMNSDWVNDDLREIGLERGMIALIRYRLGPIPGTSPNSPDGLQIIIYSADRQHARLFLMRQEKRNNFVAERNVYDLTLSNGEWAAGEGNGGVATYAAIRKYATAMAKQKAVRMRLAAKSRACRDEG
ncbi:MAG: hypothetical protein M3268_04065 [Acidobacteriota bacterium]|nr:hypothetical protein [Acidobacteriota bacterium]